MSDLDHIPAGRPIRLVPVAPGFWAVALGVSVAALAPLFGFLIGVGSKRPSDPDLINPIYVGLLIGVIVGGLGVISAVLGSVRIWRHLRATRIAEEADSVPEPVAPRLVAGPEPAGELANQTGRREGR